MFIISPDGSSSVVTPISSSQAPYIESVSGTLIINTPSELIFYGGNFNYDSELIISSNTGNATITNIVKTPNKIICTVTVDNTGLYYYRIQNGTLSSNAWLSGNQYPYLQSRNPILLTNGWLDFRSANSANFGTVISHVNASLGTKTFANSGFSLDASLGLKIGSSGNAALFGNYIQFNSFNFDFYSTKYEVIASYNTINDTYYRMAVGLGNPASNNVRRYSTEVQLGATLLNHYFRYDNIPAISSDSNYSFKSATLYNTIGYYKFIYDFRTKKINLHKLSNLTDLDATNLLFTFPIDPVSDYSNSSGCPLFQWVSANSTSYIVAIKIS